MTVLWPAHWAWQGWVGRWQSCFPVPGVTHPAQGDGEVKIDQGVKQIISGTVKIEGNESEDDAQYRHPDIVELRET